MTHGHTLNGRPSKTYFVWEKMKSRCQRESDKAYEAYGARGITVCDQWQSFAKFLEDMGEKPDGLQLERIDNNKGYSPDNCKWASRKEQARNRRSSVIVVYQGKGQSLIELAEQFGVDPVAAYQRHKAGWPIERVLLTPKRRYGSSSKPTSRRGD